MSISGNMSWITYAITGARRDHFDLHLIALYLCVSDPLDLIENSSGAITKGLRQALDLKKE